MIYTPFAGLTALDEGDVITIDGSSFLIKNPRITDHLLQVGAVSHHHDAHAAAPVPHVALSGTVVASGGTLPASGSFALTYTLTDAYGGETTPADPLVLTTGGQLAPPSVAPVGSPDFTSGIMPAGAYYYAQTYTDGAGGETTIGPSVMVYIDPGFASAQILLSGLAAPSPAADYRLWRSYEGEDWRLLLEANADTYTDAGFDPPDNAAQPPAQNNTQGTAMITVTLPTADVEPALASASYINLYFAEDTSFASPSFYATYPISSAGAVITITGATTIEGSPPPVSLAIQGAAQINPDTDILGWPWKRPVATEAALPDSGNDDGDMREALDTHTLYIWDADTSSWIAGGGVVGPTGATGAPGADGAAGATGPQGPAPSSTVTVNPQVGDYTLAYSDAGCVVELDGSAGGVVLTIPANADVDQPLDTLIELCDVGTSPWSIVGAAGVTVDLPPDLTAVSAGQWATIGLRQRNIDEWLVSGALAAI